MQGGKILLIEGGTVAGIIPISGIASASAGGSKTNTITATCPVEHAAVSCRRSYATAAANDAKRSPGSGTCSRHVTAIGFSPSWLT